MSVPQIEAAFTCTSTSHGPIGGISTRATFAPGAASALRTAFIFPCIISLHLRVDVLAFIMRFLRNDCKQDHKKASGVQGFSKVEGVKKTSQSGRMKRIEKPLSFRRDSLWTILHCVRRAKKSKSSPRSGYNRSTRCAKRWWMADVHEGNAMSWRPCWCYWCWRSWQVCRACQEQVTGSRI